MPKDNVGEFVEKGFVRERRNRADGDLAASPSVTLRVAVKVRKLDALDLERLKRLLLAPTGNRGGLKFLAFRLREHKPVSLVGEMRVGEFFVLLAAVLLGHGASTLAVDRHAERQRLLAFLHVPAKLLPLRPGGERPRLDASLKALEQSQKLVAQRIVVKAAVSFVNEAGLLHRLIKQRRP